VWSWLASCPECDRSWARTPFWSTQEL